MLVVLDGLKEDAKLFVADDADDDIEGPVDANAGDPVEFETPNVKALSVEEGGGAAGFAGTEDEKEKGVELAEAAPNPANPENLGTDGA